VDRAIRALESGSLLRRRTTQGDWDDETGALRRFVMHHSSILARNESLREEIKLMQNQERFYRTVKHDSFEENVAHTRREIRLLEMQAELEKLQRR
jgi:hypothetical protein